ncbi:MAG: SgcJ/EcaC family oxidoreductase [Planctomycetales bacterium]|nr:SgcJ/EcaC family oxidoreductase [Planctomycetales bacterium]
MTNTSVNVKDDEIEIRQLIAAWTQALEAKDVDGLVSDYAPDAVLYDAIPPYKSVGVDNIRSAWECCLPFFPEKFRSEHRDVVIHVAGDTAFMYGVHHFVPTPPDHACGQTWMRVTVGYRRIDGHWKVVHEHISIPFNPINNQAWYIRDPAVLDGPDYGPCPSS